MSRPHDTADEDSTPDVGDAGDEGRSEASGDLAGPGPRGGQEEDPDT